MYSLINKQARDLAKAAILALAILFSTGAADQDLIGNFQTAPIHDTVVDRTVDRGEVDRPPIRDHDRHDYGDIDPVEFHEHDLPAHDTPPRDFPERDRHIRDRYIHPRDWYPIRPPVPAPE